MEEEKNVLSESQPGAQETVQEAQEPVYKPVKRAARSILRKRSRVRQKAVEVKKAEPATEAPKPRRKDRVPFGSPKQRLQNPGDPNFSYRVFNDNWRKEPDRIQRAKAAGYEVVEGYEPITVGTNDDGTGIKGVLMRIPKEWYDEDQRKKQKENDRIDEEIRRGQFQEKPADKRYIPAGGIKIENKLTP